MRAPCRVALFCAVATLLLPAVSVAVGQTTAKTAETAAAAETMPQRTGPAIAWSGNKVVLTAAQSSGGVMVNLSDKTQGVSLDKSCQRPRPEVTCVRTERTRL
jgi:hypothetical protein